MSLTAEKNFFESKLPEWDEHTGKFVLLKEDEVVDFFDTYGDAIAQGYRQFGLEPFFVGKVSWPESAQLITRLLV